MATGGESVSCGLVPPLPVIKHVTLGKVLDFLDLWFLGLTRVEEVLGWPVCSAGMMVLWDVHGQVSGALHRNRRLYSFQLVLWGWQGH